MRRWLAMQQSGADFEEVVIPFHTGDRTQLIQAQSPSGLVPGLADGDFVINDSLAIAEYLAERHPEAGLWPADAWARAIARAAAAEMDSGFGALRSALPMNFNLVREGLDRCAEVDADIQRITDIWENCQFRYSAGGNFLFGFFCIADAIHAPVISRLRTYGVPVDPKSAAYMDAVWTHPWIQTWGEKAADEPRVVKYEDI
ncbi:MAG: glutathione S-transferase [Alphaproteobacteria bacterium]|nr:glutathione S-transferase [Alphaproteobacteria bacterium]